jgi:electron transport complex protein RnfG
MAVKSNLTNMVLVLGLTCLFCSAILGVAYVLTKEPIAAAAEAKTNKAIAQVLPHFESTEYEEDHNYFTAFDGDHVVGYAIVSSSVGFGGALTLMVGITPDGVVYNTSVLDHSETPGLGAKCTSDQKFMDQWRGFDPSVKSLTVKKDGGDVDAITASTITSRAYSQAVANALLMFNEMGFGAEPENEGGQDNE